MAGVGHQEVKEREREEENEAEMDSEPAEVLDSSEGSIKKGF